MRPIIKVENLSKQYRLGGEQKAYSTLRESLIETAQKPLRFLKRRAGGGANNFWALKDVNFEIMPGEVVGVVGRNGAGKSTLLKILSRITEPTGGRIELYGRIGSLLEVGTGFHPELTGRENIFLNGAILGMRRDEIVRKFDEIVDFAEIESFIDTPVKHYSSGMYTRLAFAVAANLEPEVLIVDEVLAVGDTEFQKKCLGKMESVAKKGRTVLFVSHNMAAVQSLCTRAIQLKRGQVEMIGETNDVINNYLTKEVENQHSREWPKIEEAPGNELVRVKSVNLIPRFIDNSDVIDVRTPLDIDFEFWNLKDGQDINLSFHLYNLKGECIMAVITPSSKLKEGIARGFLSIPGNFLNDGAYYISAMIVKNKSEVVFSLDELVNFTVEDYREDASWFGSWVGAVRPTSFDFSLTQDAFK